MPLKTTRRLKMKRDTADELKDQLQKAIDPQAVISLKREKPWASITFSGSRYRFEIALPCGQSGDAMERQIAKLEDHEFDLPGQFVADFLMHERRVGDAAVTIEILTIADPVSEDEFGPATD